MSRSCACRRYNGQDVERGSPRARDPCTNAPVRRDGVSAGAASRTGGQDAGDGRETVGSDIVRPDLNRRHGRGGRGADRSSRACQRASYGREWIRDHHLGARRRCGPVRGVPPQQATFRFAPPVCGTLNAMSMAISIGIVSNWHLISKKRAIPTLQPWATTHTGWQLATPMAVHLSLRSRSSLQHRYLVYIPLESLPEPATH